MCTCRIELYHTTSPCPIIREKQKPILVENEKDQALKPRDTHLSECRGGAQNKDVKHQ